MITYRAATEEDIPLLIAQETALAEKYREEVRFPYFDMVLDGIRDNILAHHEHYVMILYNDEIAGFYNSGEGWGLTELEMFIILPQFRSRGIGTAAMQKLLRESNLRIFLNVYKANTGAIAFFEKMGFWQSKRERPSTTTEMFYNSN